MKRNGPKTRIKQAAKNARALITAHAKRGGAYSGALAGEGYNGGYADALADVLLILNGCEPCVRPELWRKDFCAD
jgi:hypothetical protein